MANTYISSFSGPFDAGIDRVEINGSSVGGGTVLQTIYRPFYGSWGQSGNSPGGWGVYRFTVYFSNPSTAPQAVFWTFSSGSLSEEYSGHFTNDYEIELPNKFYGKDVTVTLSCDTVIDTTQYYYYMLYDWTNNIALTNSIETTLSSIPAPEVSGYNYLGFSYSSNWVLAGPMHNPSSGVCNYHSPQYPYVIFYYEADTSTDPLDDPTANHTNLTGGTYHVKLIYDLVGGSNSNIKTTSGSSNVVVNGAGGANLPITPYTPTKTGYTFSHWQAIDLSTGSYIDDEFGKNKVYQKGQLYFWPGSRSSSNPKQYEIEAFWTSDSSTEGKVKVYTSEGWKDCTPYVYVNSTLGWQECKAYVNTNGTYSGWAITKI